MIGKIDKGLCTSYNSKSYNVYNIFKVLCEVITTKDKDKSDCLDNFCYESFVSFDSGSNVWSVVRNNSNNAWNVNMYNGNINNNNTYNRNGVIPAAELNILQNEIYKAEESCWKNKHSSKEANKYHYKIGQIQYLIQELSNNTYKIGQSKTFILDDPQPREIFCSQYKDRIVHHFVNDVIMQVFEFVYNLADKHCWANIEGRSCQKMANKIVQDIKECSDNYTKQCWVAKMDFSGFFMSIPRYKCWLVFKTLFDIMNYNNALDFLTIYKLKLIKQLILHDAANNCIKVSQLYKWDNIKENKSLLKHTDEKNGLPIGNLYSQIVAIIYIHCILLYILLYKNIYFEEFVDDIFFCSKNKNEITYIRKKIIKLCDTFNVILSQNKYYIQEYQKGIKICGRVIKYDKIYCHYRTINKLNSKIHEYINTKLHLLLIYNFINSINSYMGIFKFCNSEDIQYKTIKRITHSKLKSYIYYKYTNNHYIISINKNIKNIHKIYIYKIQKYLQKYIMKYGKLENDVMHIIEVENNKEINGDKTDAELKLEEYKEICEIKQPSENAILNWLEFADCYIQQWSENIEE